MIDKWCKQCGEIKPLSEFHHNKRRADGLAFYCRACTSLRQKAQYAKNPERQKAATLRRRLSNPERKREEGAKWRAKNKDYQREYGAQWYQANKERLKEVNHRNYERNKKKHLDNSRRWHQENREASREIKRRWKKANKDAALQDRERRRARKLAATIIPFTPEQLSQRWDYYGRKCWICREPATATDHVKPLSKGGAHMLCNLRPICKPCNSSKHNKWPPPFTSCSHAQMHAR